MVLVMVTSHADSNNEPLTGKTFRAFALELVDVIGDDEQSKFVINIGIS